MTKSRKSKPKSKPRKPIKAKPVIVAPPPGRVVLVKIPLGGVPLIDPVKREVVIIPVEKKKGFWETIFG